MSEFNDLEINVKTEEYEIDEHGNCIMGIDLKDEDIIRMFKAYMIENRYCLPSILQFESLLQKKVAVEKAISDTFINEFINRALNEKIEQMSEKNETDT